MKPKPRRIAAKPNPKDWDDDSDLLTFEEAAALLWPDDGSPVTASTLRSAYRAKKLEVTIISRKLLVTKRAIYAMVEAARRKVDS